MNADSPQSFWLDPRNGRWIVALVVLLGAVSFAAYYPAAITVRDESTYLRQARLFARGEVQLVNPDLFSREVVRTDPVPYPVGTSLLFTPFVWAFG